MNNNEMSNIQSQLEQEDSVDIKSWIVKFLSYWYLFLIFGFLAVVGGYLFNRYADRVYQVSSTIYIKEQKMGMDAAAMMTGMNFRNRGNVDNEIDVLRSRMLAEKTLKKLDFDVSYFAKGRISTVEQYGDNPFTVEIDYSEPQMVGVVYNVTLLDDGRFKLSAESKGAAIYDFANDMFVGRKENIAISGVYNFGDTIRNGNNVFRIILNKHYNYDRDSKTKLMFRLNDLNSQIKMMSNMSVATTSKESTILLVTLKGSNPRKITTYLNQLCSEFVLRDLESKNRVSENTIMFIDNELVGIQENLNKAEVDLQNFQQGNDFMNLSTQAEDLFNYLKEQERRRAELKLNLKYYNDLKEYVTENLNEPDKLIAPSAMGIQEPLLNSLVSKLVELSSKKSIQLITSTEKNPIVVTIDQQISQTKQTLLENINNMINNAKLTLKEIAGNISNLDVQLKSLPETQRQLIGYERKFAYSENLYNFLMERRSEAQILKASNTPDNEVIDVASLSLVRMVSPVVMKNYLFAIMLGLLIPVAYILLKEFFNTKVLERKDVEKVTKFPIIGQIPLVLTNHPDSKTLVIESPKSHAAEAFRSIRTNIDYIVQGKEKSTVMVTGDIASVGKTYISINLASIYALYGKKTVLVGFDLRKPRLYQEFGLSNKVGVSSYLANKASLTDIVQSSGKLPSLDVICAGPVPPNPAELIASKRCAELFAELKEKYDYIIMDTPPLALVTDSLLLVKYCDATTYVVRQGVTNKKVFGYCIKDLEERGIKANIIINGIKYSGTYCYRCSYGYGYVYGYGYGNSYGYYGSDEKQKDNDAS